VRAGLASLDLTLPFKALSVSNMRVSPP